MITNAQSGTAIDEIAHGVYRISTPLPDLAGGFSFNQYLAVDDEPLLFHTGPRALFPLVREAIDSVLPAESLRWIAFSHVESDECGSLNDFLRIAPNAAPLCSQVAAMVSVGDLAIRPPRALGDGETMQTGARRYEWVDAPHVPHNWENGYLLDRTNSVLFCGDLFTQGGTTHPPLTSGDILGPTEAFRAAGVATGMPDYWSHSAGAPGVFARLAATNPSTLACMHGSAWSGRDGGAQLRALAASLGIVLP
jgi:glyoxylase-like metal-dependent hydrolase (beta-lactamase superfamily II)